MIYPEHTTNFVRGEGWNSNDAVLANFVNAGDHQGALEYWGFEGKYDPNSWDNMWEVGLESANKGVILDVGAMAYISSIAKQYGVYLAEKNYEATMKLSMEYARNGTALENYNFNIQTNFVLPRVSKFFNFQFNFI